MSDDRKSRPAPARPSRPATRRRDDDDDDDDDDDRPTRRRNRHQGGSPVAMLLLIGGGGLGAVRDRRRRDLADDGFRRQAGDRQDRLHPAGPDDPRGHDPAEGVRPRGAAPRESDAAGTARAGGRFLAGRPGERV